MTNYELLRRLVEMPSRDVDHYRMINASRSPCIIIMTVKDYIFLRNIMHREKYSNINCPGWWILQKRCRISIVGYTECVIRGSGSQTRGAGSDIRWDPLTPNLTPGHRATARTRVSIASRG